MPAKPNQQPDSQAAATCWVVALDCEARPLIDALGLKRRDECHGWPVFADADRGQWLVVSGVGRVASAAATGFLAAASGMSRSACWLNVGIAGHRSLALGELRRAAKIVDSVTERSWFPAEVTKAAPVAEVLTSVDHPSSDYPGGGLVEMEAAGFYPAASRLATRERVQVLKVVSDNAEQPFDKTVNARRVSGWIGDVTESILSYASALRALGTDGHDRACDRAALTRACMVDRAFRFSATQVRQFDRLVERLDALGGIDGGEIDRLWSGVESSREALGRLEAEAARRPLCFSSD